MSESIWSPHTRAHAHTWDIFTNIYLLQFITTSKLAISGELSTPLELKRGKWVLIEFLQLTWLPWERGSQLPILTVCVSGHFSRFPEIGPSLEPRTLICLQNHRTIYVIFRVVRHFLMAVGPELEISTLQSRFLLWSCPRKVPFSVLHFRMTWNLVSV